MSTLDKTLTYYLSGPMTGIPKHNYPAFDAAAAHLRNQGFNIVSPAELDPTERETSIASEDGTPGRYDAKYWNWLARDVFVVSTKVGGIIFLNGWWNSKGACLEAYVGMVTGKVFGRYEDKQGAVPIYSTYPKALVLAMLSNHLEGFSL